jgi:hypothetical protein
VSLNSVPSVKKAFFIANKPVMVAVILIVFMPGYATHRHGAGYQAY